MKSNKQYYFINGALFFSLLLMKGLCFGQGRVVINEFMPWSGCNTTSEFIELMNFGPGPMNIGCYTITNGQYSVTIPPNTILQPRQYFVLAGQNTLAQNCGNVDSVTTVDLNWTICNCTNTPVPTTGDGFMQNGGNANEKIVLLDNNLNVVDAVSRNPIPESSISITTPTTSSCISQSFDLDTMAISYESINTSSGIDNSFSRKVDGDCGWVKTTQISSGSSNKTGSTSSADYQFSTLNASECNGSTGKISIIVSASDVASLFPMNYTLAFDVDSTGIFESTDRYFYGVDSSGPSIDIKNLAYGRYRITVGSSSGCNLRSFDFFIFNCYGIVLPVTLESFSYTGVKGKQHAFSYRVSQTENIKKVVLEGLDKGVYKPVSTIYGLMGRRNADISAPISSLTYYRLYVVDKLDNISYSPTVKTSAVSNDVQFLHAPNENKVFIRLDQTDGGSIAYTIMNTSGLVVGNGKRHLPYGESSISISTLQLPKGIHFLKISGKKDASFTFIKH